MLHRPSIVLRVTEYFANYQSDSIDSRVGKDRSRGAEAAVNLAALVSDFDAVVNVHKKKESSVFNDDTEYKKCLNEVKVVPFAFCLENN